VYAFPGLPLFPWWDGTYGSHSRNGAETNLKIKGKSWMNKKKRITKI
jgi:hypothetical protein